MVVYLINWVICATGDIAFDRSSSGDVFFSSSMYSLSTDSDVDSGIAQPLPRTRTDKSRRDLYNGYVSYLSDSVPPETSSEESVFYVSVCKN